MTRSEELLWRELSGRKLGVQFRRQVPIAGRYIADFLAPAVKLIVEVDGGYHRTRACADARRDLVLARLGYRTLPISGEMVEREIGVVVELVRAAVRA